MPRRSVTQSPSHDDDTRYLISVRDERNRDAFSQLYWRFFPKLRTFVSAKHLARLDADEIIQEIMLIVWQRAYLFDATKASAATWIFSIARNRRIDAMRRVVRPHVMLDAAQFVEDDRPSVEMIVLARQRELKIQDALRRLPAPYRRLIQLTFFEGQSYREAAITLGLPEGTVKSRLRLIIGKMRAHLGGAYL